MFKLKLFLIITFCTGKLYSQNEVLFASTKVFIENKGQWGEIEGENVLFKSNIVGYNVYFTPTGFIYEYNVKERLTKEERKQIEDGGKLELAYHKVEFENGNIPLIAGSDYSKTAFFYTLEQNGSRNVLTAQGATKLTYFGIYDNIDVVFTLPKEGGLKYDIRINPGGDMGDVVIKYPYAKEIIQVNTTSIDVVTEKGVFKTTIPKAYTMQPNSADVATGFTVDHTTIRFKSEPYNQKQGLVIDPWEITPTGGFESVFDVDYDYDGNVYFYGSSFATQYFVAKYNSLGVEEWVFDVTYLGGLFNGDIAVNRNNGDCYVISVIPDGTNDILKLDTDGAVSATLDYLPMATLEIWRCEYDHCNDSLVLGVGGDAIFGQLATVDKDLVGPINFKSPVAGGLGCIDVSTMAIDPDGSSVYVTFPTEIACGSFGIFDDRVCKLELSDLENFTWEFDSEHNLDEVFSWWYAFANTHSFNGIAIGRNVVYTYDGNKLVKRNRLTGNSGGSILTGGTLATNHGIAADLCDNVFVGVNDEVFVYDSSLTLITTLALPGRCHDIQLNKKAAALYVGGLNFVNEIDVSDITNTFSLTSTPDLCEECDGTASITASCTDFDIYDILWLPTGETTTEISDLCGGMYYTCLVIYGCDTLFADSILVEAIVDCGINITVPSDTICDGECIDLIATVTTATPPLTFTWSPDITDVDDVANVCPTETTTYQVIVVDALGQTDTTEVTISVFPYPVVNLGNDTILCFDANLMLDAENPGLSYLWQDGSTDQMFNVSTEGIYWVEVDNFGCKTRDSITINYFGPEVDLGPDTALCVIEDYVLDAENIGSAYLWHDGATTQTYTVTDIGTYFVTVTDPESGCVVSDTLIVSAGTLAVNLGNDTTICSPETLVLDPEITDVAYLWQDGSTGETFLVNEAGTYWVTATQGICVDTDSIEVDIENPMANFVAPNFAGCTPGAINFTDLSVFPGTIVTWEWDFDDGSTSTLQNPAHVFETAGTYSVTLTITTAAGCTSDITKNVVVEFYPIPLAAFTFSPIYPLTEETVHFTDLSVGAENWFWDFGDGETSTNQNPEHAYLNIGNYSVTLIVTNAWCSDTARVTIIIDEAVIFYVPNAFTPDGNHFNEIFQPVFTSGFDPYDFHLTIFNRWGEIIFESYNASKGWDGKYGDKNIIQDGVYTWVIEFGDINSDKKYKYSGHVVLLK